MGPAWLAATAVAVTAALAAADESPAQTPPPQAPITFCSAYFARPGERIAVGEDRGLLSSAGWATDVTVSVTVVRTNFARSRLDVNSATGAFTLRAPRRRLLAKITYRVDADNGTSSKETDYFIGLARNPAKACPQGPFDFLGDDHWWGSFKGQPIPQIEPKLRVTKRTKRWRFTGRVAGACRARRSYSDGGDFLFRPKLRGRVGFQRRSGERVRVLLSPRGSVRGRAPDGRAFVARFETFKSWVDTRINAGTGAIRSRWRVGFLWTVKCEGARAFTHQRNAYAYEQ